MSDGSSQAGQEVALVFSVFPLDQNRLETSAQQVGAWAEKNPNTLTIGGTKSEPR